MQRYVQLYMHQYMQLYIVFHSFTADLLPVAIKFWGTVNVSITLSKGSNQLFQR